MLFTNYSQKY